MDLVNVKSLPALASESPVLKSCVCFSLVVSAALRLLSDGHFTFVLTMAALLQCFGFWLLLHQIKANRSCTGVSTRMLEMFVLSLVFRLSSTLVMDGYLPVDRSGDHVYQAADIGSLLLCCQLLWCCLRTYSTTYEKEYDTMEVWRAVPVACLLGAALHGNMNKSWFYDTTWTIGMHLDTIALLPQYWLFVKKGNFVGRVGNFVACIVGSRALAFMFWWTAHKGLKPRKKDGGGPNVAGYLVLASHGLQLLLSLDFVYHYARGWLQKGRVLQGSSYDV